LPAGFNKHGLLSTTRLVGEDREVSFATENGPSVPCSR
jgi:hypothetical protein